MGVNDVEWGDFFSPSSVGSPASSGSSDGGNGGGHPGGWASEPSETFSTPPPPEPAPITPWYETFDPSDAQVQADIEASTVSQPETIFYDTTGGDSGFTSDDTTNPYYTTDGTFIPEQKPLVATPDQHPSDFMVGNVIADALATQSVNPGYALSWDYNPDNPNNLGTYDEYGNFQTGISPTLGSIFVTDSSGNPILDSSGNPIKTNYGTDIINYVQESLQNQGPVDLSLYGAQGPTGFFENILSPEELKNFQDTWWHGYSAPGGGGYEDDWGDWGDYGERRPSLAEYARQHWFSESLSDVEAKEARREAEGLGAATMSNMDRMFAKDFSAEIGPDPFFDPDFSYEMYEDYDPIFAGMDLFQRARG